MTVSCYLGKRYTTYGDNVKISLADHTNCVKSTIFRTAIIVLVLKENYDFRLDFAYNLPNLDFLMRFGKL